MKKVLIFATVIITVIAILVALLSGVAIVYAKKNIDYAFDEELFTRAKRDQTVYYYAYNSSGALTEVYKSSQNSIREWTRFEDVGENIKRGFIAMEDREFYEHRGVNLKRTVIAAINHVFKFRSSFGASTITQQVVKNISGDNESSVLRKVKEIFRAFNLERNHSKDDIFELYLNIIPMSGNMNGVGAASEVYFGKEADQLSLAEAATIVGITNAPTKYNPYTNAKACIEKRNRVLYAMLDVGFIDSDEYDISIKEPLVLSTGKGNFGISSWFIETANDDILNDISSKYQTSRMAARLMLNGSRVILTMDPDIQNILEEYFENTDNLSEKFYKGLNYSMVISDPHTGNLLGVVGNGGKKKGELLFNYATSNITPGSVLKPIALYAPLIENGKISWSTKFDDSPVEYNKNGEEIIPYPKNTPDVYEGMIDVNDALKKSKNTVAIRLYNILGTKEIFNHLKNDYGFDTLVESVKGPNGQTISDMSSAPLALGQLSYGVPLRKLTEAYNVFAGEGELSSGRSYISVYDADGKAVVSRDSYKTRVYSRETAAVMNQLLSNVVNDGTAKQIRLKELVDVAGKTGTSGNDRDRLFIGYTPYFTAGIWCGFGKADQAVGFNTPSHLEIWDEVMRRIHEKLVFNGYGEDIKSFNTDNIVISPYCSKSGLLPTLKCELDDNAEIKFGYFKPENIPSSNCDFH